MKKKGSITVYLLLFLTTLLLLLGAVLLSARYRGAKVMVKAAARQSMFDLFSRYEPVLFEEYDLMFMDAGFGSAEFRPGLMLDCMERNAGILWGENSSATNLWGLGECQAVLHGYTLATDQQGEAFYRQAIESASYLLAEDAVQALQGQINLGSRQKKTGQTQGDVKEACDSYQEAVNKAQEGEYEKGAAKDQNSADPGPALKAEDNPIEIIKKLQKKGILGLVMPENSDMSDKQIKKSSLLSGRKTEKGIGLAETAAPHKTADHLLFDRYLAEHLSSFVDPDEKAALAWQLEYVIGGKKSDKENLKKTAEALLLLREGSNLLYLRQDAGSMAKVRTMAASIAAALAVPVGEELIVGVLCVCWAYGESLEDVRALLAGEKVPLIKDRSSWKLSLSELSSVGKKRVRKGNDVDKGLTYTDYLEILLGMKADRECLFRGMDMAEIGIRSKTGNENFSLDHCICAVEAEIRATVSGVGTISAKEKRSYEN